MKSIKVKLFNNGGYEKFTSDDRFEVKINFWGVCWVIGINSNGEHLIDFFVSNPEAAKNVIENYYRELEVKDYKINVIDAPPLQFPIEPSVKKAKEYQFPKFRHVPVSDNLVMVYFD